MFTTVVAYARFSSDNQREESIDAQLRAIKKYCADQNYILVDQYIDEARSATTDDRPAFQQMMTDAAKNDWEVVIVHKLDRFSRDRYDSAIYKKLLRDNGVRIESVLEHLDGSPESVILESLLEGMSEYYSKNLAREVRKGKQETALQCKHNGGQPPYGLNVDKDGYYVINEYEADAVRHIFNAFADGLTLSQISQYITSLGYSTRKGNSFSPTTINTMLHNEKYQGTYVYNRTVPQPKRGKRTNASRPDDEILRIPDGIPAIIDKQLFRDVQISLERRGQQSAKRSGGAIEVYLLQGLIKCGNCDHAMIGSRRKDGRNKSLRITYECSGRKKKRTDCKMRGLNRDFIENLVIDFIEEKILSDAAMVKVQAMLEEEIVKLQNENPDSLNQVKKELNSTNAEIDKLIDAILSGVDPNRVKDKINTLEQKATILREKLDDLETRQNIADSISVDGLEDYLLEYRNIRQHSRPKQKEIINKFIKEIIVYDNDNDGDKIIIKSIIPDACIKGLPNGEPHLHVYKTFNLA